MAAFLCHCLNIVLYQSLSIYGVFPLMKFDTSLINISALNFVIVAAHSLGHCVKEPVLRCDAVRLERPHLSGQHRLVSSAKCARIPGESVKNRKCRSHFCSVYVRTDFQGFPLSTSWQLLSSPSNNSDKIHCP